MMKRQLQVTQIVSCYNPHAISYISIVYTIFKLRDTLCHTLHSLLFYFARPNRIIPQNASEVVDPKIRSDRQL